VPFVVTEEEIVLPFEGQRLGFLEPRPGREKALDDLRAATRGPYGDWHVMAKGWKGLLLYHNRREGQETLAALRPDLADVAQDALGRVYALDAEGRVLRMGTDRRTQEILVQASWKRAAALDVDTLGQIYVLDRGTARVHIYGPDGRQLAIVGPSFPGGVELREPRDLAVDGSGRLYIADSRLPFVVVLE
ncbi:MAG: hypothetical protein MI919_26000, partial [Holophagales bacterium]|nr:hypothetical protein [Holophagales bacterium]